MNLGLKEFFRYKNKAGKSVLVQTNFKEKVLAGFFIPEEYPDPTWTPKIHSIRKDKINRWRAGMSVQFAHGIRTSWYNCWHRAPCTGVQSIEIYRDADAFYWEGDEKIYLVLDLMIRIDGKYLPQERHEEFAINDGFDNLEDFCGWFNEKYFKGRIVHWTEFRYTNLLTSWNGQK